MDPDSSRRAVRLRVAVTDRLGRPVRVPGLAAWLTRVAPASARGAIAIALVTDARIRGLNNRFRRVDAPTDVLSFPGEESADARRAPRVLGDIVISVDTARRQAREAGHDYLTELKVLALHGLLHLLGYDHHAPSDRGRMARLERRLRAKGGLRAGLIERAGAGASKGHLPVGVAKRATQASRAAPSRVQRVRRANARAGESEGRRPWDDDRAGESEGRRPSGKP